LSADKRMKAVAKGISQQGGLERATTSKSTSDGFMQGGLAKAAGEHDPGP
jgi:hypothetical protein